jgi:hypothetical protein
MVALSCQDQESERDVMSDEPVVGSYRDIPAHEVGDVLRDVFDRGLREGRREILAEIAEWDEPRDYEFGACFMCQAGGTEPHTPSCLWVRAQRETAK